MKNLIKEEVVTNEQETERTTLELSSDQNESTKAVDKKRSILSRCAPSETIKPKFDPNKLNLIDTPRDEVFSVFTESVDVVAMFIKTSRDGFYTEDIYVVADELHETLADIKSVQSVTIFMMQKLTGELVFTYCKNGPLTGGTCSWFESKRACFEEAKDHWLSINTNRDEEVYEATIADEQPELPSTTLDFYEALELTLEDRFIDSLDHPVLVANNIGQPKRTSATNRRIRRARKSNESLTNE